MIILYYPLQMLFFLLISFALYNTRPINLNVSGIEFVSTSTILNKIPYIENIIQSSTDDYIYIDKSPDIFKHVLNWARDSNYEYPFEYGYELWFYKINHNNVKFKSMYKSYVVRILDYILSFFSQCRCEMDFDGINNENTKLNTRNIKISSDNVKLKNDFNKLKNINIKLKENNNNLKNSYSELKKEYIKFKNDNQSYLKLIFAYILSFF